MKERAGDVVTCGKGVDGSYVKLVKCSGKKFSSSIFCNFVPMYVDDLMPIYKNHFVQKLFKSPILIAVKAV